MRQAISEALGRFAERTALISEQGCVWTYAHLEREARDIAARIAPDKLAVIEGANSPATIAAYLGVLMAGGVAHLAEPGQAEGLQVAFGPLSRIRCDGTRAIVEVDEDDGSAQPIHPDLVLLFSTSGTTGRRKLVKITANNIYSNSKSIIQYLDMTPNDRAITSLKPSYTFGLSVINSHLLSGGALLLTDRSIQDPAFWDYARTSEATTFAGVPHSYEVLADNDNLAQTPSLRLLLQAGGKLRPELVRRYAAEGRSTGRRFCVMYGQTEASPRMAYLPPEMAESAPEAIGVAIPGGELTLEDEHGRVVEALGVEGELIYRGPNVMAGYALNRQDLATATSLPRLATGDLAIKRQDGLFTITGRRSRFIKPLGRRIGLDEVEQSLADRGVVAAVAAEAEGMVIVYEGAGPVSAAALAIELGLPRSFVRTERVRALPRLASGKVNYPLLGVIAPKRKWLPANLWRFLYEASKEVWNLIAGGRVQAAALVQIYSEIMNRSVNPTDCFIDLGADSLRYVELSIALEEAFGELPQNWTRMTVLELQQYVLTRA